ncbi:DUF4239 domain-containing protein [Reyranella aquatilis]|jgi:hypothetical protein|uniref:DUF4239 domain-containing protein n=1 Tax=Reyranella aquatilis TaxID=2035356 RepID=A0ABS8KTU1_9HYPH|nr:DUF4239 domain-containing protein [Reyranella aquatilis]MCC8429016.1 DUF4239 domain-containing protein [Reyranella aquatilis]
MIDWLYSLPETLILVACALIMAGAILAMPSLVHRLPGLQTSNENNDFVLRMQATLFTMTSLVLAFTLVEAEANFRKADALVSNEASQINRLDRLLNRYGDEQVTELRLNLLEYTKAIVDDEWPAMLRGERSDKVRLAFAPLSRGIFEIEPKPGREATIYAEILRSFDSIAESRDARLNAVSLSLPQPYWQVVLFAVLMLLFITSTMQRSAFRAYVLAAQMAVMGAFIGFVFIMDQPFKGQTAVDAKPLRQAIVLMENRDR